MEHEISSEMIERFILNQSSAEEVEIVGNYLKANPAVLDRYLDLRMLTEAMDMENSLPETKRWQPEERRKLRKRVFRTIDEHAIPRVYRAWLAVACCIVVACTVYYFLGSAKQYPNKQRLAREVVMRHLIENNSDTVQAIKLWDGSMVAMQPQTSLYYRNSFQIQRDLYLLHGSAVFRVKRNEKHPFTVIADGIATTALGTVFLVEARGPAGKNKVSVQLKSGKVVVHSRDVDFELKPRILVPGQTLVVDKLHGELHLIPVPPIKKGQNKQERFKIKQVPPANTVQWLNNAFHFSAAALGAVFDHIADQFHLVIIADPNVLKGKHFTGTIYNSDDPQMLIKTICSMNELTYIRQGDTLTIQEIK